MYHSSIRMNHVSLVHGLSTRLKQAIGHKQKIMNKSILEYSIPLCSRKFYVSTKSQPQN